MRNPSRLSRTQLICAFAGMAALLALPGCAHGTEDPAKTRRFTAFLQAVLARKVPHDMDGAMRSAFTPDRAAQIAASFAHLGAFEHLQFVTQDTAQGYRRYFYRAIFKNGSKALLFVLDAKGKIAGFFQP